MSIVVRPFQDSDLPDVLTLITNRIGEEDAPEAELVLTSPEFDKTRWSVAADGDRVVSTLASFPMDIGFGSQTIPGSMIEFVATDEEYEGQGLVRRQFDYQHQLVAERGELLQMIVGITYFYRRLGYEYAVPVNGWRTISADSTPGADAKATVRTATIADLELVQRLQQSALYGVDITAWFGSQLWSFILTSPVYEVFIAEIGGAPVGMVRLYMDDDEPFLMDLTATETAVANTLLSEVGRYAPGQDIMMLERPANVALLDGIGSTRRAKDAYYARVGDPAAFLNAVRPELSRRLAESDLADASGDGLISLYSSSVRFTYGNAAVGEFTLGPREQSPVSKGGSGVAPDLFTSLVVGPLGFEGLADRHPDVHGGKQMELMKVLFPPLQADFQSWVLP